MQSFEPILLNRQVLDCASPLALFVSILCDSARGLALSKTLAWRGDPDAGLRPDACAKAKGAFR
jgi:hypothetical protein